MAWGFFELGDDPASDLRAARRFLTWRTSSAVRTKETATVSTPWPMAKMRSSSSLGVSERYVDGDAGEVDALVLAEHAAVDDLADDVDAFDVLDVELDEAVGEGGCGSPSRDFRRGS